jgi:hypothetical protein
MIAPGTLLLCHHGTAGALAAEALHTGLQRSNEQPAAGFTLAYDKGLKRETVFRYLAFGGGSPVTHLTVTEYYPPPTMGVPANWIVR